MKCQWVMSNMRIPEPCDFHANKRIMVKTDLLEVFVWLCPKHAATHNRRSAEVRNQPSLERRGNNVNGNSHSAKQSA